MKKAIIIVALMLGSFAVQAQVKTPQPSPKAYISQAVGLTDVEVEYSRPSAKKRIIFGDLVPFGKLWRTGANANTTISFSEDISIDGRSLKKGKYALYTVPKADNWEVIFYSSTNNWGTPENFDENKVALRTLVKPEMTSKFVETFTIGINNLTNDYGYIELAWEKMLIPIKFDVPTQKAALASIEKTLAGPSSNDYYSSAQYFYQSNLDMNKALTYINKALDMSSEKPYYQTRLKSLIQAKLGDKRGAIETAKVSLAAAETAKNADYVKMNKDSINEWSRNY